MTISSSLNAGVSGLSANASRLATISDNIANSGTNGYKRADADFHSMVNGSSPTSYSAGGVRVSTSRDIAQNGSLSGTQNATDLAIRGRGFLPVASETALAQGGNAQMMLTTTGSFRTDDEGVLKTSTGQVLMGWPADQDGNIPPAARDTSAGLQPIVIDSTSFTAVATDRIGLGANLPATATGPDGTGAAQSLSVEYFDNLGSSERLQFDFAPSATDENQWELSITDSATGNPVNDPATGAPMGPFQLTFADGPGEGGRLESFDGGPVPEPLQVQAGDPAGDNTSTIGIDIAGALSQLGDEFAPTSLTKNGSPVSSMVSVEVDKNGYVNALYDTGISKTLYQVPVVDVRNPNGLTAADNGTFLPSTESGDFYLWDAGSGPTGDVAGYSLEQSTVDVAGELTSLIETQRAYSSNAKVIQTVDEMLQETTNIKR